MRIGILTYSRAYNYGAFLQAYALKTYIESLGHTVEFVDYESERHSSAYSCFNREFFKSLGLRGKLSYFVKSVVSLRRNLIRHRKMDNLQRRLLNLNGECCHDLSLLEKNKYDCMVYGSDQIWRKSSLNPGGAFDAVYWGEGFCNTKKIAYAPSMGIIDINSNDRNFIKSHLSNFAHLSCRELDLIDAISGYTSKAITQVVDPVFLLDYSVWDNKIKARRFRFSSYVLIYNLMHDDNVVKTANILAKKYGLEIVEITGAVQPFRYGRNVLQACDPFDFIALIKNARYVIASSFHAVAFSVIFKKDFYAMGMKNNSGRVRTLLESCGLGNRLINEPSQIEELHVDYSKFDMTDIINHSKSYLKNAINQ